MAAAGVVLSRYTSSPTVSLFHPRRLLCSSLSFLPSPATHKPRLFICRSNASFDDLTRDQAEEDLNEVFFGDGPAIDDESDDEEQDTESSVDLLLRFLQSMFRKVAKRAKKASRSVLPAAIPPQLVSFAVDGLLLLASLSILKALLEVACTLGGSVFVVILLLRVIWATASYFQSNGGGLNQGGNAFGAA